MIKKRFFRNLDYKWDVQLTQASIDEQHLGEVLSSKKLERANLNPDGWTFELKTERWQWEQTGNICVEYRNYGKLSGIAKTEADFWVHELARDDDTLVYIMIPVPHLQKLAKKYIAKGMARKNAGDNGASDVVLIPIQDLLK